MQRLIAWLSVSVLLFAAGTASAQSGKRKKAEAATAAWQYDIRCMTSKEVPLIGDNHCVVVVTQESARVDIATAQSKKNAVHGVIFKGLGGDVMPALYDGAYEMHQGLFDAFFADGGAYAKYADYVKTSIVGAGDVVKVGKIYRVSVAVKVDFSGLRTFLEENGVIEKLATEELGIKPTLMLRPSLDWCIERGYVIRMQNGDRSVVRADYERVFAEDREIREVFTQMQGLMNDRDMEFTDMAAALEALQTDEVYQQVVTTDEGSGLMISAEDMIKNTAHADIIVDCGWSIHTVGGVRQATVTVSAHDAYTNAAIASVVTDVHAGNATASQLVRAGIQGKINQFCDRLKNHFAGIVANGREISLECRLAEDCGYTFNREDDMGDTVSDIVTDIVRGRAQGRHATKDGRSTSTKLVYRVHIPLMNEDGYAQNAEDWGRNVRRDLRRQQIVAELKFEGLGKAVLIFK